MKKLRREFDMISIRKNDMEDSVQKLVAPSDFWFGFVVIVVFAILGLFFPVFLLPVNEYSSIVDKWIPLALFSLGFLLVIFFVAYQIKGLKKRE